jgi:predicted Fe-Mo cluster-binding NifX family protein
MNQILSIPVHNNRVSPLFDVAGRFIVLDPVEPEKKSFIDTTGLSGISIVEKLNYSDVSLVICSAISRIYALELARNNIGLIFGIIGSIDEIIAAYLNNSLSSKRFAMPGCKHRRRLRGQCPYWKE